MTDSSRTRKKGAGALPMAETRIEFARLLRQGISNADACRMLKINRRTGMRWRHGRIVKNAHGRETTYASAVDTGFVRRVARGVYACHPRTSEFTSPMRCMPGHPCGGSPRRWVEVLPPSAEKCGAIVPRAQSATLPELPKRSPTPLGNALGKARSPRVRPCVTRSRSC